MKYDMLYPPKCGNCEGNMNPQFKEGKLVGWYCLTCAGVPTFDRIHLPRLSANSIPPRKK